MDIYEYLWILICITSCFKHAMHVNSLWLPKVTQYAAHAVFVRAYLLLFSYKSQCTKIYLLETKMFRSELLNPSRRLEQPLHIILRAEFSFHSLTESHLCHGYRRQRRHSITQHTAQSTHSVSTLIACCGCLMAFRFVLLCCVRNQNSLVTLDALRMYSRFLIAITFKILSNLLLSQSSSHPIAHSPPLSLSASLSLYCVCHLQFQRYSLAVAWPIWFFSWWRCCGCVLVCIYYIDGALLMAKIVYASAHNINLKANNRH